MYFLIFLVLLIHTYSFQNNDRFTSAEIAIPFKTLSERKSVVLKTNILGESKNCSIDITSSEQILFISNDYFPDENSLKDSELLSITDQEDNKLNGYRKNVSIEFTGNNYRKGVTIQNVKSILIKTDDINKIHSFGFAHNINPENSLVHQLYNSHFITQRQFSILFSYPDWGTLSFGEEGSIISHFKDSMMRTCSAVKGPYWGCHLSGIYIENLELPLEEKKIRENNINIEVDQDTIFDLGIEDIIVPEEIFEFFYQNYFKKQLFIDKKCSIFENKLIKKIVCEGMEKNKNINEFEKMDRVHFVFDDIVDIYVLGKYFFDDKKNFRVIYIKNNRNIIIGKAFLSKYNMIYNYDEDKIKFFGMFGGRFLEKKLDYDNIMKNKLVSNAEYIRYNIEKINVNKFPLFTILFIIVTIINIGVFYGLCKLSKKKKEKALLDSLNREYNKIDENK
jgi:hypothetical protein